MEIVSSGCSDADIPLASEWAETPNGHVVSVNQYWSQVATLKDGLGNPQYNSLMVVVKQADVERRFSVFNETRVKLKQHTISAIRTVKDVINKYKEVEQIPVTWDLIRRFHGTHATYTEYLSMLQKEATATEEEKQESLKRAKETESLQQKQTDIIKKQKDAKQLISEANDRLLNAAANHSTSDLMAAQAVMQSGTTMLMEARMEWQNLKEAQQSNTKTESQMNIDSDFYYSITLCNKWHGSLFTLLSLCFVNIPIGLL